MTEFPPPVPSGMPSSAVPPPPPVAASSTKNNWQGIVAAITGVLGLGLLGIIFGALGLQSVKAHLATNRGLALTGVIAGGFWIVAGLGLAIVGGVSGWGSPTGSTFTYFEDLKVGDCFAKHGDAAQEGEDFLVTGLYTMSCESPHYGEVYYIDTIAGSTFPGTEEAAALTDDGCFTDSAIQDVDIDKATPLGYFYLYPTAETWAEGDHEYVCMFIAEAEDLVGSVLLAP